jgi:hypothetical protein
MAGYERNADGTWTMTVGNYTRTLDKGGRCTQTTINSGNGFSHTTNYSNGQKISTTTTTPSGQKITTKY